MMEKHSRRHALIVTILTVTRGHPVMGATSDDDPIGGIGGGEGDRNGNRPVLTGFAAQRLTKTRSFLSMVWRCQHESRILGIGFFFL